ILPDGTRRLAAHLVAESPAPSASEVRQHLRTRLPAAMIPSAVELVDRFAPRTASGKIDRAVLSATSAPPTPHHRQPT
ncbi:AMP-binding enzyme, partial [Streptomyces sp. L7]